MTAHPRNIEVEVRVRLEDAAGHAKVQVRFRRYRFSATGDLGYRGFSGAEGKDTGAL